MTRTFTPLFLIVLLIPAQPALAAHKAKPASTGDSAVLFDDAKPCLDHLYKVYEHNGGIEQFVAYDKNNTESFVVKSDDEEWNTIYTITRTGSDILASQPGSAAPAYVTSPVFPKRALRYWTGKALEDLSATYRRDGHPDKTAYLKALSSCAKFYDGDLQALNTVFESESARAGNSRPAERKTATEQ